MDVGSTVYWIQYGRSSIRRRTGIIVNIFNEGKHVTVRPPKGKRLTVLAREQVMTEAEANKSMGNVVRSIARGGTHE